MERHDHEIRSGEFYGSSGPISGASNDPFAIQPESDPVDSTYPRQPAESANSAADNVDAPLPLGTRFVDEYPVPELLQYDHQFLALPRDTQKVILQNIQNGLFVVQRPPVTARTEKKTARLRVGQWARLGEIIGRAEAFEEDRRRSLTENSLLREVLEMFFTMIAPHLDLQGVATEDALRTAVMRAYRKSLSDSSI